MNSVGQVELGVRRDAFHEERNERNTQVLCDTWIDRIEAFDVALTVTRWDAHAEQQHRSAACSDALYDGVQVLLNFRYGLTANAVVCTQLDDDQRRLLFEDPVDTAQPACAGVAAQASIEQLEGFAPRSERALHDGWKSLIARQMQARRDAVAEEGDFRPADGRCRCWRCDGRRCGLLRGRCAAGNRG